LLKDEDD